VLLIVWVVWYWSTTPAKRTRAFIAAIERRDAGAVYALILPQQRQAMDLTPDKVRAVLEQTVWRFGAVKAVLMEEADIKDPREVLWVVAWGDAATGGRLPVSFPKGLITEIVLRPTRTGWRVDFARFLHSACCNIWEAERGRKAYPRICRQAGVHPISPF